MKATKETKALKKMFQDASRRIGEEIGEKTKVVLMDEEDRHLVSIPGKGWAVIYRLSEPWVSLPRNIRYFGLDKITAHKDTWIFPRSGELVARIRIKLEQEDLTVEAVDFYEAVIEELI